ncbi:hypothetical protein WA026_010861 [Henosepilachna vigintioctopunctata]|uniref:Protein sleepless n=1 Tax=Henosepilachna vigintioctopunctata TaxID=420089 RepID=A0AAW1UQA4_9CUCU
MILISILLGCLTMYCVYSISCYRCESTTGTVIDACAYGPNYGELENCDAQLRSYRGKPQNKNMTPKHCFKVTGLDSYGRVFTGRGCIPYTYNGHTCKDAVEAVGFFSDVEGGVKNLSCYPCNTDECNASFTVKSSMFKVFIISIITSLCKL